MNKHSVKQCGNGRSSNALSGHGGTLASRIPGDPWWSLWRFAIFVHFSYRVCKHQVTTQTGSGASQLCVTHACTLTTLAGTALCPFATALCHPTLKSRCPCLRNGARTNTNIVFQAPPSKMILVLHYCIIYIPLSCPSTLLGLPASWGTNSVPKPTALEPHVIFRC